MKFVLTSLLAFALLTSERAEALRKKPLKNKPHKPTRGAPAPIAGVGLPSVALAGVYWFVRRRNRLAAEAREKLEKA